MRVDTLLRKEKDGSLGGYKLAAGAMNYLASSAAGKHGDLGGLALMAAGSMDKLRGQLKNPQDADKHSVMGGETGRSAADLTGLGMMAAPIAAGAARGGGSKLDNALYLGGLAALAVPTLDNLQANYRARKAGVDPEKKMLLSHRAHRNAELAGYGALTIPVLRHARHQPLKHTAMELGGYGLLAAPHVEDALGRKKEDRIFQGPTQTMSELAGLGLLAGGTLTGH